MLSIILMCISHFMFFGNDLLLAVYFIFILDQGNDISQKAKLSNFLIQAQNGHQAAETICNIKNAFGLGIANECTVQWWSKKFCKEDKRLEDDEHSGWPLEVDNNQPEKLPKNSMWTILWSFSI